jgi:putative PIN family toxin of toxin-antitoxin system
MRALIDTNVLIGYLLLSGEGGAIRTLIHAFEKDRFTMLLPEPLLQELIEAVRGKRRLSSRISPQELEAFIETLRDYAEKVGMIAGPIPKATRDVKDDYLLAYALVGKADHLVIGDKDLLALQGMLPGLEIVTPARFVEVLNSND